MIADIVGHQTLSDWLSVCTMRVYCVVVGGDLCGDGVVAWGYWTRFRCIRRVIGCRCR